MIYALGPTGREAVTMEKERPILGVDEGRCVVPANLDAPLDEDLLRALEI